MASNTTNLNLYKKDPIADKDQTFNITTMMNENWDKIDQNAGQTATQLAQMEIDKANASDVNTALDLKANKQQQNWIAATLVNGWVNMGSTYEQAAFYKDEFGMVHVKGFIKSGVTTGYTQIFALPVGYKPAVDNDKVVGVLSSDGTNKILADLYINPDGISIISGGNVYLALNIPPFKAGG